MTYGWEINDGSLPSNDEYEKHLNESKIESITDILLDTDTENEVDDEDEYENDIALSENEESKDDIEWAFEWMIF